MPDPIKEDPKEDEGGSNDPNKDQNELLASDAVQKAIRDAVKDATDTLKLNRDDILNEKKIMSESLKKFESYDLEKIDKLMDSIEKSDDAKMIAEGKFDEILEKRTSQIRDGFSDEITTAKTALETAQSEIETYKARYEQKIIADDVRAEALKQGVRPDAINDVIARSTGIFELQDGKTKVAKPDGYVDSVERFIKSLKDSASYYWPDKANFNLKGGDHKQITDRMNDAAEAGDFETYKKMREAQTK